MAWKSCSLCCLLSGMMTRMGHQDGSAGGEALLSLGVTADDDAIACQVVFSAENSSPCPVHVSQALSQVPAMRAKVHHLGSRTPLYRSDSQIYQHSNEPHDVQGRTKVLSASAESGSEEVRMQVQMNERREGALAEDKRHVRT